MHRLPCSGPCSGRGFAPSAASGRLPAPMQAERGRKRAAEEHQCDDRDERPESRGSGRTRRCPARVARARSRRRMAARESGPHRPGRRRRPEAIFAAVPRSRWHPECRGALAISRRPRTRQARRRPGARRSRPPTRSSIIAARAAGIASGSAWRRHRLAPPAAACAPARPRLLSRLRPLGLPPAGMPAQRRSMRGDPRLEAVGPVEADRHAVGPAARGTPRAPRRGCGTGPLSSSIDSRRSAPNDSKSTGIRARRPRSRAARRIVGTSPRSSSTIGRTSKMNDFVASRVCWTIEMSWRTSALRARRIAREQPLHDLRLQDDVREALCRPVVHRPGDLAAQILLGRQDDPRHRRRQHGRRRHPRRHRPRAGRRPRRAWRSAPPAAPYRHRRPPVTCHRERVQLARRPRRGVAKATEDLQLALDHVAPGPASRAARRVRVTSVPAQVGDLLQVAAGPREAASRSAAAARLSSWRAASARA